MGPLGMLGAKAALALGTQVGGSIVQHNLNRRSQDRAFQQNVDFWRTKFDETNKYNSPVQQIARLKEAGLNPAMMYGQSASGATGTAIGQSSEGAKAAQVTGLDNLGLMSVQAKQIKEQTELTKQDAALRRVQALTEMQKAAKTKWEAKTAKELAQTSADLYKAELTKAQQDVSKGILELEKYPQKVQAEVEEIIARGRLAAANAETAENKNEVYNQVYKEMVKAGIDMQGGSMMEWALQAMLSVGKFGIFKN